MKKERDRKIKNGELVQMGKRGKQMSKIVKEIDVSGVRIEVQKKKIKNLYLSIKPPDGRVVISAPYAVSDRVIREFAKERMEWIIRQKERLEKQPVTGGRQYLSGETLPVWGKTYTLIFQENGRKNSFSLCGNEAVLSMRDGSTVKQREAYIREQYRAMLKEEVERLLPKWEALTGLHCNSWHTKYMKTRWGTCNTVKKRLWFNVQLAEKPLECLEYVILHELTHTRIGNHGREFSEAMDRYMPEWRDVRKRLNGHVGII